MKQFKKVLTVTLSLFVALAIAVGFMTACSSEDEVSAQSSNEQHSEYAELMAELSDYTATFCATHESPSRKDWGWKKFRDAVNADFAGYSNGSAVACISTSRRKWKELKLQEQLEDIENSLDEGENNSESFNLSTSDRNYLSLQIDSLRNVYLADKTNVGALHNAAIYQSMLDDDTTFETTEELVQSVIRSLENLNVGILDIDEKKAVQEVDEFFETIYDENVSVMFKRLSQKYPEKQEAFKVLNQYGIATSQIESVEDLVTFSEGYMKIIRNSGLTDPVKDELIKNISIFPSSQILWSGVDDMTDE